MISVLFRSVAAGASIELFDQIEWSKLKLQKQDGNAQMGLLAAAAGMVVTIFAGTELVAPEGPISAGGTVNVAPKIPDDIQYNYAFLTLDELSAVVRNTTVGAVTLQAIVDIEPV